MGLVASQSIARNLSNVGESLVVVHRASIKVVPFSPVVLPVVDNVTARKQMIRAD